LKPASSPLSDGFLVSAMVFRAPSFPLFSAQGWVTNKIQDYTFSEYSLLYKETARRAAKPASGF